MGISFSERWQKGVFDSSFTIGAVALASLIHFALGEQFTGRTPFLVSILAVMVGALRGGLVQGLFATTLSLAIEIMVWGEWGWLRPDLGSSHFTETILYLIESLVISLLAEYYLDGRIALRQSQACFQMLFDAVPVGVTLHRQNTLIAANKAFANMFGFRPHEMGGAHLVSLVAPESVDEAVRRMRTGKEETYRITALRQSGTTFPVEVTGRNIYDEGKPIRVTILRDLTGTMSASQWSEQMDERVEARVAERTTALAETVAEMRATLETIKTLTGLLAICGSCKRIREDDGSWSQVEDYIRAHSTAEFSHTLCPDCLATLREEIAERQRRLEDDLTP